MSATVGLLQNAAKHQQSLSSQNRRLPEKPQSSMHRLMKIRAGHQPQVPAKKPAAELTAHTHSEDIEPCDQDIGNQLETEDRMKDTGTMVSWDGPGGYGMNCFHTRARMETVRRRGRQGIIAVYVGEECSARQHLLRSFFSSLSCRLPSQRRKSVFRKRQPASNTEHMFRPATLQRAERSGRPAALHHPQATGCPQSSAAGSELRPSGRPSHDDGCHKLRC